MKIGPSLRRSLWALIALIVLVPEAGFAQPPEGPWADDLLAPLVGAWDGQGTVYGNEVALEREWSLELGGQFLRGDMRVKMANGRGFRALTYWNKGDDGRYRVTWMDEIGKVLRLEGLADLEQKQVTVHYLDEPYGGGPEWRRTIYRWTGPDSYQELLYKDQNGKWEPLGTFRFTRRTGVGEEVEASEEATLEKPEP
jgi:hypothetical protein